MVLKSKKPISSYRKEEIFFEAIFPQALAFLGLEISPCLLRVNGLSYRKARPCAQANTGAMCQHGSFKGC